MGRTAIRPGRWGRVSLIPEVQTGNGKWIPIPEGERGRGTPGGGLWSLNAGAQRHACTT